jgi:2-polyprenyl-3-methyl-5-hydroxy-6-metoxy-1,4-benzoquinol methylase
MPTPSALASAIPVALVDRARREREFFNQHSDPGKIPDQLLIVPQHMEAIPPEVADCFPSFAGKSVCEVGCGYGVLSAYFAQQGAQVFGFDVAETNVMVAARTARVNGVSDRIFLQVMQGECLAFADDTFDLVFGNAVLHHLDIAVSAHEIFRILKPGGVAIFREPLGENRLLEWLRNCSWRSTHHRHTEDEHSLLYRDVETLRTVFPKVVFRESELLSVLGYLLRKAEVGMIAIPRWERAWQYLAALDQWLLARVPMLGPWASYCVVSLVKPGPAASPADFHRAVPLPAGMQSATR